MIRVIADWVLSPQSTLGFFCARRCFRLIISLDQCGRAADRDRSHRAFVAVDRASVDDGDTVCTAGRSSGCGILDER